jgi:ABC-2 type transport system permease protein
MKSLLNSRERGLRRILALLNNRILALIKRELREKLMSKAFIFMTLLVPLFIFGIIGLQMLIIAYRGDKGTRIELITESESLTDSCSKYISKLDFIKDGTYIINYNTVAKKTLEDYIEGRKKEILSGKLNGVIFVPSTALEDKKIEYYSKTPNNLAVYQKLNHHINKVLIDRYFSKKILSDEELKFARMGVQFNGFKVSEKDELEEEGLENTGLAFFFSMLIFFSILFSGGMTMNSVLEEKGSKVVEVLLSSVNSRELMTGKILGCTITVFAQMVIWLLPVFILITTTWFTLPEWIDNIDISYGHLFYFLFNFLLACLIFQGLYATIGAIFDNAQEAQSGVWPVVWLIMIPYLLSITLLRNPNNPIAIVSSYIPFATLIIMPCRFTIVDIAVWKLILSQLINIATLILIFPLAGKIYRIGIMRSGKKPTFREVLRWLKS